MKTNLLKSIFISLILLVGATNAWADITFSGGYIYFDNSIGINQTYIQLCARQSSWTGVSTLSKINNTKLYYVANPQGSGWGGILGWVVIGNSSQKSNSNFDNWSSYGWCSNWNTYGFNSGSTYLIVPSSTSKSQSVTTSYYSGGYSALNSTQTIKTAVNGADANSKATITVTSYKLTGNGAISAQQSASIGTSAQSTTISAARTATTTLTVGSVATGYQFDGWYTAATGGTQLSTSTTYTYYPIAATTVYARFSEKKYTVTVENDGHGITTPSGAQLNVGQVTGLSIEATPDANYEFVNWTITSGSGSFASATSASTTFKPTSAATIQANFRSTATYFLNVMAGDGISQVSGSIDPITLGNTYDIKATTKTGYTFSAWTANPEANATFGNATTANTTVTVKNGSVTVTASATETLSNVITANGFDKGNPDCEEPTTSSNQIGISTTATITATDIVGYTFTGWTLTNCTRTDGGAADATSITVRSNGDGKDVTITANYTEILNTITVISNDTLLGSVIQSDSEVGVFTSIEITATPKLGCTFTGWTAKGDITFADASSATTTVTATGTGTITATFKETKHTVTIASGNTTQGTVSPASVDVGQLIAVTITATPKDGYRFVNWVATNGITIADEHDPSTTITAANPGTVTAKFDVALATTIYLRPNAAWRQANARFAVYYWKGNSNGWLNMTQVSDNQDYYQATIPAGYTDFKFVRMNPNGANNWDNDWNQTGDLKLPSGGKNLYDMRLHLKPNSNWLADGARFAARFYVEENGNTIEKWVDLTNADGDGVYECDVPIDRTYPNVILARMNPTNKENNWTNRWNQTGDLDFDAYYNSNDFQKTANLFTIPSDSWDYADNNNWSTLWKTYTAYTYGVTLYKSNFGQYGFIHNGIRYYSPVVSNDTTYQIPIDATITLFSNPYNVAYNGNIMIALGDERFEMVPEENDNPTLKVSAPIVLDDNYKTKNPTVVYLGVPNNGGTWVSHAGNNIMYAFHGRTWLNTSEYASVKMTEVGRVTIKVGDADVEHIYYSCVIPAGYNNIRFENRKNAASFASTDLKTKDMAYRIPLNSLNCYTLGGKENDDNHKFIGGWDIAPAFEGDFRIWHQRTASVGYASDIIRKGVQSQIVSLHIYPIGAGSTYPKLTLQKRVNGNWTDVTSKLVKDISKIKNDSQDQGCGVWNFTVTQSNNSATVNFTSPQRYTGNYYIRTNNSEGGWYNYALATNQMTFSSYAKAHSHYTHYFCKWITTASPNVKFIVANDYCAVLSNELAQDSHTAEGGIIVENANVRWSWNEMTNEVSRAYILGTHNTNSERNSNIVINYNNGSGTVANKILNDLQDWIYEIDLTDIKSGATLNTLQATYPSKTINGVTADTQTFAKDMSILKSDDADSKYTVRVIYDFKINQTLVMLVPVGTVTTGVDVLIERKDQGDATQVQSTINAANMSEGYTVYATMTFTKAHLESVKSDSEKLYYWVSFPFNVRISDVFGFGEYGKHWIMQYYDGEKRAQEGCWAESSFWTFVTDTTGNEWNNGVLEANRGYVLALAKKINEMGIFSHNNTSVSLYFPSREKIKTIGQGIIETSVNLAPYTCTIERDNRKIYDSNWHMIGVPSYSDKQQTIYQDSLLYYYAFDATTNKYTVTSTKGSEVTFKSMHSYLVQFAGTINWRATWQLTEPQGLAARRDTDSETDFRSLRLELQHNGEYADQTFVQMQSEQATAEYDMNIDLTKFMNAGANIYTLTSDENIQLAGNVLPLAQTTIALGVVTTTDGEYTFTMPEGTDGMMVELIDYVENTTTNLLFNDYIVNLPAGTYENRFALHIQPSKVVTNLDNILDAEHGTKKYIINGQLIIQTPEGIFNAQGTRL